MSIEDEIIENGNLCLWKVLTDLHPENVDIEHTKKYCNGQDKTCEYYLAQKDIYCPEIPKTRTGL